jgi:hypothetical protein
MSAFVWIELPIKRLCWREDEKRTQMISFTTKNLSKRAEQSWKKKIEMVFFCLFVLQTAGERVEERGEKNEMTDLNWSDGTVRNVVRSFVSVKKLF